nr:MAG TPA: hypothetical protein [Caudoviricetes sp.]DAQ84525.1 MAG TPA: hypothetical protein [Caudoviricetes sp.]
MVLQKNYTVKLNNLFEYSLESLLYKGSRLFFCC